MIRVIVTNLFRFFFLIFFQVLFLRNFSLYNLAVPYFYVLFILLLPIQTSNFILFLLSFLMGLSIDAFSNTLGIHTAACILMAFCRILLIRVITPREGYENTMVPSLNNMGIQWFLVYSIILILVHHIALFNLEIFRFSEFLISLIRATFSAVFTLILVLISQYLFPGPRKQRH